MTENKIQPDTNVFLFPREHEPVVHRAVCRMLFQAAGGANELDGLLPVEISRLQVEGAFVTLKRDQQLRSCYGCFGGPYELSSALVQAALGAATKDPRFPMVSVGELPQMHTEISLLYNIQPIEATGTGRRDKVTIGRHGLTVRAAGRAGLLLPRVATDFGLDAEGFLAQVCMKAGLPARVWMDDEAQLQTFETYCFGGLYVQL